MLADLIKYADSQDMGVTGGDWWRSEEEQTRLFNAGYSKVMTFGFHQRRLAVDLNIFINDVYTADDKYYKILGDYWESLDQDNIWGGRWLTIHDKFHFQFGR